MNSGQNTFVVSLPYSSSPFHFGIHNALKIVSIHHNCATNILLPHCSPDPASDLAVIGFGSYQNPQISQRGLKNSARSGKLSTFVKTQHVCQNSARSGKTHHIRETSARSPLLSKIHSRFHRLSLFSARSIFLQHPSVLKSNRAR